MSLKNIRTGREFSDDLNDDSKKLQTFLSKTLPDKVKDVAQHIVDDSFSNEQYQDGQSSKWEDRKNDSDAGKPRSQRRALLVKDGVLIKDVNVEQVGSDIVIGTNVPYAKRHNEGLDGMPKRQYMPIEGESNPVIEKAIERGFDDFMKSIF